MHLPEFLTLADFGEIRITGHRIGLFHLVRRYNDGASADTLVYQYPTLSLSLVNRVIAFYRVHGENVDAYLKICQESLEQQLADSPRIDAASLRSRMEAVQHAHASLASDCENRITFLP